MSEEEWVKEIVGMRRMAGQFANIDPCEISGAILYKKSIRCAPRYESPLPTRRRGHHVQHADEQQLQIRRLLAHQAVWLCER